MIDLSKADSDRYGIVVDLMQAWADEMGSKDIGAYARKVNAALSRMMPLNDLYGSESHRHGDLRREVATILGIKIDRRNRANYSNAARVDDLVDSFWYFTMAIRTLFKADPDYIWGFRWDSRCNERRQGNYACEALNGRKWKLGDPTMPLPVRDTSLGCNCLIFEVFNDTQTSSAGLPDIGKSRKSLLRRLLGM